MRKLVLSSLALLAFSGAADARDRRAVPEATPLGEAVSCVPLRSIQSTRVHGDSVIDFHMNGGKVYRNTLPNSCPGLGFEERFAYQTSLSQLCNVDIITVLPLPGLIPGPSCGLGKFQPVELAKIERWPRTRSSAGYPSCTRARKFSTEATRKQRLACASVVGRASSGRFTGRLGS